MYDFTIFCFYFYKKKKSTKVYLSKWINFNYLKNILGLQKNAKETKFDLSFLFMIIEKRSYIIRNFENNKISFILFSIFTS